MKRLLFIAFLLADSSAWSADNLTQCANQADRDLAISLPFFKNPEGVSAKMAEAEAMLTIVRKPTTTERVALADYQYSIRLCLDRFYSDNQQLTRPSALRSDKVPLDLLRDGEITFAEYAKERIKELREADRLIAQYEREEQERRKPEERNRPITLSCTAESGRPAGLEFQYQINEEDKTIWASRGGAVPSSINIGPTEITFMQADGSISISRNTGRFSITSGHYFVSGTCQTIEQRKF